MKQLALSLAFVCLCSPNASSGPDPDVREMALIPAGEFWMGRYRLWLIDEIGWQTRDRVDDRPMHRVDLPGFYMDRYEVVNAAYASFLEATDYPPPFHWQNGRMAESKPRHPVYNVSWEDARAYCAWVGKRLPTEAEWEKAARGGWEKRSFPWGDVFQPIVETESVEQGDGAEDAKEPQRERLAHFGYPEGPTEVGQFPANDYGLYDMSGNVWEWVEDGYELHYYSVSPRSDPRGPESAPYKVYRGGSWGDRDDRLLSVYYRNFTSPETRTSTIGFRCAMSAERD